MYNKDGAVDWSLALNALLPSAALFQIQDVRYAEGVLYFNEECKGPAVDGLCLEDLLKRKLDCGRLIAVRVADGKVLWRSAPFVSHGAFELAGNYVLSTYSARCLPESPQAKPELNRLVLTDRREGVQKRLITAGTADTFLRLEGSDDRWAVFFAHMVVRLQLTEIDARIPKMNVLAIDPYPP